MECCANSNFLFGGPNLRFCLRIFNVKVHNLRLHDAHLSGCFTVLFPRKLDRFVMTSRYGLALNFRHFCVVKNIRFYHSNS